MPAIAADGQVVVIALEGGDGGRGYPNLRFEVRDRSDHVLETISVIAANDWERLAPDGEPGAELRSRVDDVNRKLGALDDRNRLVAMPALAIDSADNRPHLALGKGITVDWTTTDLEVWQRLQDRPMSRQDSFSKIAAVDGRAWLVPREHDCEHPAFLRAAYHQATIHLVLVDVAYAGTDTCWEPADQWHVVSW